ncbi:MAG: hypothetical protein LC775_00780, partial [Acidobacteria bacterium]|nr:hypothetical protein [Acidobacteriota bacterium]
AEGCGQLLDSPELAITVQTWEYGVVGAVRHPGGDGVEPGFAALRRYVREQGYGIVAGTEEQVYLSDPRDRPAGPMLLLLQLRRFS